MTYLVKMVVRGHENGIREVTTCFAGCVDEDAARRKAAALYTVVKFKKVEPVPSKEKR